jgi:hypothetical protein
LFIKFLAELEGKGISLEGCAANSDWKQILKDHFPFDSLQQAQLLKQISDWYESKPAETMQVDDIAAATGGAGQQNAGEAVQVQDAHARSALSLSLSLYLACVCVVSSAVAGRTRKKKHESESDSEEIEVGGDIGAAAEEHAAAGKSAQQKKKAAN